MGAHISNPSPNPSSRPASIIPAAVGRVRLGHLLNLPNILTLCRIGMVPIFLVLLSKDRYTEALYVFVLAAMTDGLDGAVARWFDIRTELGAFLDPFADKLMLLSAFVVLTIEHALPVWLLILTAIRDIVIVVGYLMISFAAGERLPVRPSVFGKLTTVMQIVCVIGTLTRHLGLSQGEWYAVLYRPAPCWWCQGFTISTRRWSISASTSPNCFPSYIVLLAIDDLGGAQLLDRRSLDSEFAQDFVGVLAEAAAESATSSPGFRRSARRDSPCARCRRRDGRKP